MAREDEIILENLTNRGLGASPVAFREVQQQSLPSLRSSLLTSNAIREQDIKKRQFELATLAIQNNKNRTSGGGGRLRQTLNPVDFNKVIPLGFQSGQTGVEPTVQLAKLLPTGGAQVIAADVNAARQKFGVNDLIGLPKFDNRLGGTLNQNTLSSLIADLGQSGNQLLGLKELQRLLSLQGA
ncbi:MAG: hypothetical protein ACHQ1D_00790 [Nitrososphaerales archaeon]